MKNEIQTEQAQKQKAVLKDGFKSKQKERPSQNNERRVPALINTQVQK